MLGGLAAISLTFAEVNTLLFSDDHPVDYPAYYVFPLRVVVTHARAERLFGEYLGEYDCVGPVRLESELVTAQL